MQTEKSTGGAAELNCSSQHWPRHSGASTRKGFPSARSSSRRECRRPRPQQADPGGDCHCPWRDGLPAPGRAPAAVTAIRRSSPRSALHDVLGDHRAVQDPRVVIGENQTFGGNEEFLRSMARRSRRAQRPALHRPDEALPGRVSRRVGRGFRRGRLSGNQRSVRRAWPPAERRRRRRCGASTS